MPFRIDHFPIKNARKNEEVKIKKKKRAKSVSFSSF
jgi:hypothetical protein